MQELQNIALLLKKFIFLRNLLCPCVHIIQQCQQMTHPVKTCRTYLIVMQPIFVYPLLPYCSGKIYCKVKMSDNHNEEQEQIICLIEEITNVPEGSPCFLCLTTDGKECLWHEIGEDIVAKGNDTQEHGETGCSMVEKQKTGHFTCYRYYTFTIGGWSWSDGKHI